MRFSSFELWQTSQIASGFTDLVSFCHWSPHNTHFDKVPAPHITQQQSSLLIIRLFCVHCAPKRNQKHRKHPHTARQLGKIVVCHWNCSCEGQERPNQPQFFCCEWSASSGRNAASNNSCNFPKNRQSNNHGHFRQGLAMCAVVKKQAGFELLFQSYLSLFACTNKCDTVNVFEERFTPPSSVAVWNSYFAFRRGQTRCHAYTCI